MFADVWQVGDDCAESSDEETRSWFVDLRYLLGCSRPSAGRSGSRRLGVGSIKGLGTMELKTHILCVCDNFM